MKGTFVPVGPKQIGFVPNKLFEPCGANAGGVLVKHNTSIFF